ncbi:MAG TPA: hypothetical protein VGF53_09910, partial [Pseudolabrys sp.]
MKAEGIFKNLGVRKAGTGSAARHPAHDERPARVVRSLAVDCDRMTHGWLDRWLSNGDTYCKRAAWAWEIEQAAWRPTTISLRG